MIFVDTSAWFAGSVPSDQDHAIASLWFSENIDLLITTDYVTDETLTLLGARNEHGKALELADQFFEGDLTEVIYISEDDVRESVAVFKKFFDKNWSFTDCTSKHICDKFGIDKAISFDKHFRQFGSVAILP